MATSDDELHAEIERLRSTLRETRDELAKWGWGDMHYGQQPQERSVVDTLAKIDVVLGSESEETTTHLDFDAMVSVGRCLPDGSDLDDATIEPIGYHADIRVWCKVCGEPFCWLIPDGSVGLQPDRPMIDPEAQELRAPLRPKSSEPEFGLTLPGFHVRVRDVGGERT